MKVECKSCFTDVLPMADGSCPSCGKSTSAVADPFLTKVTFRQKDEPDDVCLKCGVRTSGRLRYREKARNTHYQPNSSSQLDSHPLAILFNLVAGKYHQFVEVSIALCDACRKTGKPEPHHIDFDAHSITFIGHQNCKVAQDARKPRS